MEVSRSRRAVKNHALEVFTCSLPCAADKFFELFFCHHFRNLLLLLGRDLVRSAAIPSTALRARPVGFPRASCPQPWGRDAAMPAAPQLDYQPPLAPPPPELPPPNPPNPPPPPPQPPPPRTPPHPPPRRGRAPP